ncbi:MAG: MtsA protein [Myxococcota bacterium]
MGWLGRGSIVVGIALGLTAAGLGAKNLRRAPRLVSISPLQISNETDYPATLFGEDLDEDLTLVIEGPGGMLRELPTVVIDRKHLGTVIPAGLSIAPEHSRERLSVKLLDEERLAVPGEASLTVVNDTAFFTPMDLAEIDGRFYVASPTTDEIVVLPRGGGALSAIKVGDGPRALAPYRDPAGRRWLLVVLEHQAALEMVPLDAPDHPLFIATSPRPQSVVVDEAGSQAYVSSLALDVVEEIDLIEKARKRAIPVHVNPRTMALSPDRQTLWVSHLGSEDLLAVPLRGGDPALVAFGPGLPILGGRTEAYAGEIMGGKPARALVSSKKSGLLFAATIGPNIGPNKAHDEVSMNGGITVVDAAQARALRHVSIFRGVPQSLALDDERDLLYVADESTGRVLVLDAARLGQSDQAARTASVAEYSVEPPADFPLIRPVQSFGVERRADVSLHSGPWKIVLGDDGASLFVLNRFTRTIETLDTREVRGRGLKKTERLTLSRPEPQGLRRRGEIIYFTDLGNSRMTCDTCHPEGRDGGLLFTKGHPMQIHRSPSLRSAPNSPPYFTPSKLPSLMVMAKHVLARNRFENPEPSQEEIAALTEYTLALVPPPNPFRGAALPKVLRLPDGHEGDPRRGMQIFEGRGGCADLNCHPPPHYTADQDKATRGQLFDVGTPMHLPLREALQDAAEHGMPPPSLVGVWDNFPLLFSGSAGFRVEGDRVLAKDPFALRRVFELRGAKPHGKTEGLSSQDLDDVLAFLMTL